MMIILYLIYVICSTLLIIYQEQYLIEMNYYDIYNDNKKDIATLIL